MKAQKGGKYGFVNTHGIEIIPLIYDDISEFYEDVHSAIKRKEDIH